jgi:hypothetical protein
MKPCDSFMGPEEGACCSFLFFFFIMLGVELRAVECWTSALPLSYIPSPAAYF